MNEVFVLVHMHIESEKDHLVESRRKNGRQKPTVSVDVKQYFNISGPGGGANHAWRCWLCFTRARSPPSQIGTLRSTNKQKRYYCLRQGKGGGGGRKRGRAVGGGGGGGKTNE